MFSTYLMINFFTSILVQNPDYVIMFLTSKHPLDDTVEKLLFKVKNLSLMNHNEILAMEELLPNTSRTSIKVP